jgi:hypothetical protein
MAYYSIKGIERYLARRTIRGRQRQIEQLVGELRLLERLGVADRALLLFAFQMLFALLGLAASALASSLVLPFLHAAPGDPVPVIEFIVAFVIAILAFYAASVFRKLEDPQPTLAKLRDKLRTLGADDQGQAPKGGA